MSMQQNQRELDLLQRDPGALLTHYQFIIEVTVSKFIGRGYFQGEEKEELVQEINLELLEKKMERIRTHFTGQVYLRTYFSKVVYNSCLEIARRRQREPQMISPEVLNNASTSSISVYEKLAIRDELNRLEAILKGQHRKKWKSDLCLKTLVRIILSEMDLQFFESPRTRAEIATIKEKFFADYSDLSDKEVFAILVLLFNKMEGSQTDGDSLRRWVQQLLDRIILILNGDPPVASYDRDALKVLLQMYFGKD